MVYQTFCLECTQQNSESAGHLDMQDREHGQRRYILVESPELQEQRKTIQLTVSSLIQVPKIVKKDSYK